MAEYNVEVPESLKRKPGRPKKAEAPVEMTPEPRVALDSQRRRVRLRGADHALPCTISGGGREISVTLQPNRWTDVPEEIYQMLKQKFGRAQREVEVPDWDSHRIERTPRYESTQAPIIEGL